MSKKSRKRNKKILGILAAGLGAAALMKRRKLANATDTVNPVGGVDQMAADALSKAPVTNVINPNAANAAKAAVVTSPVSGGGGIHAGKPKTLHLQKMARAHLPKGPPGWDNPYQAPVRPRGRLHSNFKKGGRVTGIAKRGFGRALMKGKK